MGFRSRWTKRLPISKRPAAVSRATWSYTGKTLQNFSDVVGCRHPIIPIRCTTWVLSFEKIEKAKPAAAELLRFCAFLDPDMIPEELFREGARELGPRLKTLGSNALALNDAISEILKYSLLRRNSNTNSLEIHRLVQIVLKQGMDEGTSVCGQNVLCEL